MEKNGTMRHHFEGQMPEFVCLFDCGISLTSGQPTTELFPDVYYADPAMREMSSERSIHVVLQGLEEL